MDLIEAKKKILMNEPHIETTILNNIASFNTDMKVPLKECKVYFEPIQEGSGDPSPDNVRPISGWTGFDVHVEGKNIIDKDSLTGTGSVWQGNGVVYGYSGNCVTPKIAVKPGATYYINRVSNSQNYVSFFDRNKNYLRKVIWDKYVSKYQTIPDDVYYIGITISTQEEDKNSALMQLSSYGTQYAPYIQGEIYPISWQSETETVYGGYVDLVNGVLVKTYQYISLGTLNPVNYGSSSYDGTLGTNVMWYIRNTGQHYNSSGAIVFADKVKWAGRSTWDAPNNYIWQYCINAGEQLHVVFDNATVGITDDMTFAKKGDTVKSWLQSNPMTFVLPLKNSVTYQLTPTQIKTLRGTNNIWSDANGNIELKYWTH